MGQAVQYIARLAWLPALVALAGCDKLVPAKQPMPQAGGPPKTAEVLFELPVTGEITDYEDFTGRAVAMRIIEVRARVTGYLHKINFKDKEGGYVEKGDVLFEIDPRPYAAEMDRVKAEHAQAQAHAARLELDYQRSAKLVETRAVTREQFDLVAGDRAEAKAAIEVAKANLEVAELNLSFTKVHAPISGRISRTQMDTGNVVKADDTLMTVLVADDPMYVYFDVDERTLLRIRRYVDEGRLSGQDEKSVPVLMGLADEEGYPRSGVVNFVDNQIDPGTGTLQTRGIFRNQDHFLTPGLFVRVRLPIGKPYRALLVSEQALGTDQGQKFVYVVDAENKAQYRQVQVGKLQDGRRAILKGLSEGERVVVNGLQRVRPGALVEPKPAEQSPGVTPEVADKAGGQTMGK